MLKLAQKRINADLVDKLEELFGLVEVITADRISPGHATQPAKHRFCAPATITHLNAGVVLEKGLAGSRNSGT